MSSRHGKHVPSDAQPVPRAIPSSPGLAHEGAGSHRWSASGPRSRPIPVPAASPRRPGTSRSCIGPRGGPSGPGRLLSDIGSEFMSAGVGEACVSCHSSTQARHATDRCRIGPYTEQFALRAETTPTRGTSSAPPCPASPIPDCPEGQFFDQGVTNRPHVSVRMIEGVKQDHGSRSCPLPSPILANGMDLCRTLARGATPVPAGRSLRTATTVRRHRPRPARGR
jgi:hypothetical protein